MTFFDAVRTCLSKYAAFDGRAARPEFWWFFLFMLILSAAADVIEGEDGYVLGGLLWLALLLPWLAVSARRLRDAGRSAAWLLVLLVPVLGTVAYLVLMAQRTRHGPYPA